MTLMSNDHIWILSVLFVWDWPRPELETDSVRIINNKHHWAPIDSPWLSQMSQQSVSGQIIFFNQWIKSFGDEWKRTSTNFIYLSHSHGQGANILNIQISESKRATIWQQDKMSTLIVRQRATRVQGVKRARNVQEGVPLSLCLHHLNFNEMWHNVTLHQQSNGQLGGMLAPHQQNQGNVSMDAIKLARNILKLYQFW